MWGSQRVFAWPQVTAPLLMSSHPMLTLCCIYSCTKSFCFIQLQFCVHHCVFCYVFSLSSMSSCSKNNNVQAVFHESTSLAESFLQLFLAPPALSSVMLGQAVRPGCPHHSERASCCGGQAHKRFSICTRSNFIICYTVVLL